MIDKNGTFHLDNDPPLPGDWVEYGWYDPEVENEINRLITTQGIGRTDALISFFGNVTVEGEGTPH